jgi:hypothetical protein
MSPKLLYGSPYIGFNPRSVEGVFAHAQVYQLLRALNEIRESGVAYHEQSTVCSCHYVTTLPAADPKPTPNHHGPWLLQTDHFISEDPIPNTDV